MDDNLEKRYIRIRIRILSSIELFLRLRFPCLKLEYDRVKCFSLCRVLQRKKMVKVKRLALSAAFSRTPGLFARDRDGQP